MIEIKTLQGESFDLYPDTTITFERANPFFYEEVILISMRSYQFSLPRTPQNDRLLKNFAQPSAFIRNNPALDVDVLYKGNLFMKAQLNIYRSPHNNYVVTLTRRYVEFRTDLRLREIPFDFNPSSDPGSDPEEDPTTINGLAGQGYPDTPVVFPMWYNRAQDGISIDPTDQNTGRNLRPINWYNGDLERISQKDIVVPTFFLPWVIKEVTKSAGSVHAAGSFFQEPWLQDKLIFNTTATNKEGTPKLCVDLVWIQRWFGTLVMLTHIDNSNYKEKLVDRRNTQEERVADWYDFSPGTVISFKIVEYAPGGAVVASHDIDYTTISADILDPQTLLTNLRAHILSVTTGLDVQVPVWLGGDKRVYLRITATSGTSYVQCHGVNDIEFLDVDRAKIDFENPFDYNDIRPEMHLPDLSVSEFLNGIAQACNLAVYLDDKREEIQFVPKYKTLRDEATELTPYLIKNYDKEAKPVFNMFLKFKKDSNDKNTEFQREHANNYPEHVIDPRTEVEVNCSTLEHGDFANRYLSVVITGNSPYVIINAPVTEMEIGDYEEPKPFALRIMKHEGWTDEFPNLPTGIEYIRCSNAECTPNEMFEIWHRETYQVLRHPGRFFWFRFDLPIEFILNMEFAKKWQILNNAYVWHTLKITLTMKGEEEMEAKCLKL